MKAGVKKQIKRWTHKLQRRQPILWAVEDTTPAIGIDLPSASTCMKSGAFIHDPFWLDPEIKIPDHHFMKLGEDTVEDAPSGYDDFLPTYSKGRGHGPDSDE